VRSFLDTADIDPADPRPYAFLAGTLGLSNDEKERVTSSFKRFLDRRPDSASANYYYALALSKTPAPDSSQVELRLKRAIELDPNLAKAHLLLADTLAGRSDYEAAIPEYESAIRLDHSLNDAHYRLALAYKRVGKQDLSVREMQIFRLPTQQTSPASERIDLAQFVSVMADADHASNEELQCPAASR
jgi:tetratricopeptide (TPR) repeat protein